MKKNKVKIECWGDYYRVSVWRPSYEWWYHGPGIWVAANHLYYDYNKAKAAAEEMIKFPEYYENC